MEQDPKIRIVIPVHNRRDITLRCLAHLRELRVPEWAGIVVVDDGSTDGTAEAVESEHPEATLLRGDGRLWWGGAIRMGMEQALADGAEFVFWLNDDCFPEPGALEHLLETSRDRRAIVTAQTFTDLGILYGGRRKTWTGAGKIECAPGEILPCDFTTGNCVCLPAEAIRKTGLPRAEKVPHQWADHDYGLLVREKGFPAFVSGDARCNDAYRDGNLAMPEIYNSWLLSDRPILSVWKDAGNPKSALYLSGRLSHFSRHWGSWGYALAMAPFGKLALVTIIRAVIPRRWLRAIFGKRSRSWQLECLYGKPESHAVNRPSLQSAPDSYD